jgi:hypothetical protein
MLLVFDKVGHVLKEGNRTIVSRRVGITWRKNVPIDDDVDAELLAPLNDVLNGILQTRLLRIASLPDIHRGAKDVCAPIFG